MYKVIGYRVGVVSSNLKNSFPQITTEELKIIEREFYAHFCDILVETFKSFTISEKELRKRLKYVNPELVNQYAEKGISVIGLSAHYGNWEIGALGMGLFLKHKTMGIFRTLSNSFWDEKLRTSRGRFGLDLVSTKQVKKWVERHKKQPIFPGFMTDQMPSNKHRCYWTNFLNQDTAVFLGAERFARDMNVPVIFGKTTKLKRGYYSVEFFTISEKPATLAPGELTEKHTRFLEEIINEKPAYWLWTHKRWKNERPVDYSYQKVLQ